MKDKFRFVKNMREDHSVSFERLLPDEHSILDADFLLSLYHEAIEAESDFVKDRTDMEDKMVALQEKAKELGGTLTGVDFEGNSPIPSEKAMANTIESIRLAYLVALAAKNFHLFVEAADRGELGMSHTKGDVTKTGSNYAEKWEYVVREDFIRIPCSEKIRTKCAPVREDMEVLEWNAPGHDREGEYSDTGFPSKWNTHVWRMPLAVRVITSIVWKGAKVKFNPYDDFRDIFFSGMCCGSWDGGGRFNDNTYPRVWNSFGQDCNSMQHKFPFNHIEWDDRVNITEIVLELLENGKSLGKAKTIK